MAPTWYYRTAGGKEEGPFSAEQLRALAAVGLIGPTAEVKKRSVGRWVTADKVRGLLGVAKWYYRNSPSEAEGPFSAEQLRALAAVGLIGPTTEVKKRSVGRWVTADKVRGLLGEPAAPAATADGSVPPAPAERPAAGRTPPPEAAPTRHSHPGARAVDADGGPVPASWGTDSNAWAAPAPKPRSPLLLLGTGSASTLLVIAVLAVAFGDGQVSPSPNLPGGADARSAEWADRRDAPPDGPAPSPAPAPNGLLVEAKRLLLGRLSDVGGAPEDNVKAGIDLLTRHLARPDAPDRDEAARLLEQARAALSDDKALRLLLDAGDFDRNELAGKAGGFGRSDLLIVSKSRVDALCPGLSGRLKTELVEEGREPRVFVTGQDYRGGGRNHNSIETAFYETLKRNADRAIERVAGRRAADREERAKRRDEQERQAVLRNGTDEFERIVEAPDAYAHGHYFFDGLLGGRRGNMWRQLDAMRYSVEFRCRNKLVPAVVRPVKDRLQFVVPDDLGTRLLDLKDGESFARVFCRIRYGDPDADAFPTAVIYKIELYDNESFKDPPIMTVK